MEQMFYTLHVFMLHSKGVTYILMGVVLLCFVGFWKFLTGRDEKMSKF